MNTNKHPTELVIDLLSRSICNVQVAAVIADNNGIFSWGHNSMGPDGLGEHAEVHALGRANPKRLRYATMYVAARRKRNGRQVQAKPCELCQKLVWRVRDVVYRDPKRGWIRL